MPGGIPPKGIRTDVCVCLWVRACACEKPCCAAGCEALMKDPLVRTATMEILPQGKTRPQIQREIKAKEHAVKQLSRRYGCAHKYIGKYQSCMA